MIHVPFVTKKFLRSLRLSKKVFNLFKVGPRRSALQFCGATFCFAGSAAARLLFIAYSSQGGPTGFFGFNFFRVCRVPFDVARPILFAVQRQPDLEAFLLVFPAHTLQSKSATRIFIEFMLVFWPDAKFLAARTLLQETSSC